MSKPDKPIVVMVAVYTTEIDGDLTLATLNQWKKDGKIEVIDAAVMVREGTSGSFEIKKPGEPTAKRGAKRGAIAGGLLSVIFPPSILALGAAGAVAGAVVGHFRDHGLDTDVLKEIGDRVPRGGSAIVAVIEERWVDQFAKVVKGYGELTSYSLDPEAAARLIGKE